MYNSSKKGYGKTFPNPMVGCIIVLENKILEKDIMKNLEKLMQKLMQ